ncbi:hypothetical protein QN277_019904 [Acacia crassicarpa]|uniref:GATA-type domain-containing protein n=1 Tax=Acacia crassicarpa TaxID=499986 RepID=A0AAE1JMX2_9FABA|nr:hypothetical protein QN277_019904 [Acacia crassicarpa]
MMTSSHHHFDYKRKVCHNDRSSASIGTTRSLRICTNFKCRTRNTPMWRRGPLGPKTLCNACGIQYKKQVSSNACGIQYKKQVSSRGSD